MENLLFTLKNINILFILKHNKMKSTDEMLTDAIKRNQQLDAEIKEVNKKLIETEFRVARLKVTNELNKKYIQKLEQQIELIDKLNNVKP